MTFRVKEPSHWPTILRCWLTGAILLAAVAAACAQEPTKDSHEISIDHITAAVCQVESGCVWLGPGLVKGRVLRGASGELGPWQAMPYTVRELGRSPSCNGRSTAYAEATFRIWYVRLLLKHGTHAEALAAYHRGSRGVHSDEAKDYARRVMNLAEEYAR